MLWLQWRSQITVADVRGVPFSNATMVSMVSKIHRNDKFKLFWVSVLAAITAVVTHFVSVSEVYPNSSSHWYTCADAVILQYSPVQKPCVGRVHERSRPNTPDAVANSLAFVFKKQCLLCKAPGLCSLRHLQSAFKRSALNIRHSLPLFAVFTSLPLKLNTNGRVQHSGRYPRPCFEQRKGEAEPRPFFASPQHVDPAPTNAQDRTGTGKRKHISSENANAYSEASGPKRCRLPHDLLIYRGKSKKMASRRAALRKLVKEREANTSPTWRDYLCRLPEEEDEAVENARIGLPPPHARFVKDLPVKTVSFGNETIHYRQAMDGCPMYIDLETFERIKAQWADDPDELARLQREEKEAYGIHPDVPDGCWIPLHRNLPVGRHVISRGLLPTRATADEAGCDYIEEYYDPERDYSWSYRRSNPLKQIGLQGDDIPEGARDIFDLLESEEAKRYYLEKVEVPERQLDDGVFRNPTLEEQVVSGMGRSTEGLEPWHFTSESPYGHKASYQNFARSFTARDLPWIESALSANATGSPPPSPPGPPSNLVSPEEAYHLLERHVSLPFDTGCASPKVHFPKGLPALPLPKPGPPCDVAYRQLGHSDLWVSEVGLGSMFFGSAQSTPCGDGNFNEVERLLDYAVDTWGINFIDTSELYPIPAKPSTYGLAEIIIGKWLSSRSPTLREKLVIATKVAGPSDSLTWLRRDVHSSDKVRRPSLSKANILKAAHGSLQRLQTEYIDLLQLHWPQRYVPLQGTGDFHDVLFDARTAIEREEDAQICSMEEQLEAIAELLQAGKIRAWGLSNETPYGILRFTQLAKAKGIPPPASVQVHYNLLFRSDVEKQMIELARPKNTGISLLAYGALAGGLLSGKYLEWLEPPTAGRLLRFPSYMKRLRGSIAAWAVRDYFKLARRFEQPNLTTVALKWVLSRPFITSTVLGFSDFYQLRENLYCLHPVCGAMTDMMEREINFIHWKWRDPLKKIQ